MFRGRSAHVLDSKGRLSIPVRFREVLRAKYDDRLYVTNTPTCLVAYPLEEWRGLEERFSRQAIDLPQVRSFQRYFMGAAVECALDGQGRINISPGLREEAGLTKEVFLSGMLTYFEIWNKERLDEELAKARENFDQYISVVAQDGIRA